VEEVEVNLIGAIRRGLARDREEIRIARVRQLVPLARLLPSVGDRIVQNALRSREG
jgi:hypothetical protein